MDGRTVELILLGYVVSLPVVVWGLSEIARIPRHIYTYTPFSPRAWIVAIGAGYACFGIGGVLMVGAWVQSAERAELREDLALDRRWDPPSASRFTSRASRRRDRQRRTRWAAAALAVPLLLVVALTATRVS